MPPSVELQQGGGGEESSAYTNQQQQQQQQKLPPSDYRLLRLEAMSKSQAAVLRASLGTRMKQRDEVIEKAIAKLVGIQTQQPGGEGGEDSAVAGEAGGLQPSGGEAATHSPSEARATVRAVTEELQLRLAAFVRQTRDVRASDAELEHHLSEELKTLREENSCMHQVHAHLKDKNHKLFQQANKFRETLSEIHQDYTRAKGGDGGTGGAVAAVAAAAAEAAGEAVGNGDAISEEDFDGEEYMGEDGKPSSRAWVRGRVSELQSILSARDGEIQELRAKLDTEDSVSGSGHISGPVMPPAPPSGDEANAAAAVGATALAVAGGGADDDMAAQVEALKGRVEKHKKARKALEKQNADMLTEVEAEMEKLEKAKDEEIHVLKKENKALAKKLAAAEEAATKGPSPAVVEGLMGQLNKAREAMGQLRKEVQEQLGKEVPACVATATKALQSQVASTLRDMEEVKARYARECRERKRLFNVVQELRGNIRVFCRCRPPSHKELEGDGSSLCVTFPAEGEVECTKDRNRKKAWEFDQVFGLDKTQDDVYREVSPLVTSVLDGYNVCIFAYGQTGTGKTYTMTGPEGQRGVNTKALEELFAKSAERSEEHQDELQVSILEIYNEQIRDLLSDNVGDRKLEVRQGEHGMHVPDLTLVPVTKLDAVIELLRLSEKNRSSACTNMNEHSSRSHMMLSVYVKSTNLATGVSSRGKMHLIDLAGSERIGKSGATGQALKEAQNINKSLSALGDVIAARASKQGHVPYRNSTLTYLLQDSLSADSKTLMFVCISPVAYNAEENFCSLNFAARVRAVELGKASKHVTESSTSPAVRVRKKV